MSKPFNKRWASKFLSFTLFSPVVEVKRNSETPFIDAIEKWIENNPDQVKILQQMTLEADIEFFKNLKKEVKDNG